MAYHNLNEKSIPLTSYPDVPIASPPSSPAIYSQPVAQPVHPTVAQPAHPAVAQAPVAVAYAPQMYQPVQMHASLSYPESQPPMYAQAPLPQSYAPSYQPYPPPSPIAQPALGPPSNYADLKASIRARNSQFGCSRYIGQANQFCMKNFCAILGALVMWSLLGWGVNAAINGMAGLDRHHPDEGQPWDYEGRWPDGGDVVPPFYDCKAQQERDELNCGGLGCFRTKCESDGSFSPRQTLGSSCWCVDTDGSKFVDTVQHCSLFTTDCALRRTQTECESRRAADIRKCEGRLGCFKTECEADGSFSSKQQLPGTLNTCFCVNAKGEEVNGTRGICDQDCETFSEAPYMGSYMPSLALKRLALWGFLHVLATIFLWNPVIAGLFVAVFNAIKNSSPLRFRDFFSGFSCPYYCKLLRLSVVLRFAEAFLLLLVLPGIWWMLATLFAVPVHREHSFLGVGGSIRISMMVIHRHFCSMIGFLILLSLLQILGFLCFLVGLLYTMPLAFVALCFCYHDLIGVTSEVPFAGPVDEPVVHV